MPSVQNVLEVKLYDNDTAMSDDLISTLLFDVNTLTMGQRETKVFPINDQVKPQRPFELTFVAVGRGYSWYFFFLFFTPKGSYRDGVRAAPEVTGMTGSRCGNEPSNHISQTSPLSCVFSPDPPCEYLSNGILMVRSHRRSQSSHPFILHSDNPT